LSMRAVGGDGCASAAREEATKRATPEHRKRFARIGSLLRKVVGQEE